MRCGHTPRESGGEGASGHVHYTLGAAWAADLGQAGTCSRE